LLIAGVSLLVRTNALSEEKQAVIANGIKVQKTNEDLKTENDGLKKERESLKEDIGKHAAKIDELKNDLSGLTKLKEKLEEDLKDELMKKDELLKQQQNTSAVIANNTTAQ
jgi:uncharacterized coiled-coil DUF342 family protein